MSSRIPNFVIVNKKVRKSAHRKIYKHGCLVKRNLGKFSLKSIKDNVLVYTARCGYTLALMLGFPKASFMGNTYNSHPHFLY